MKLSCTYENPKLPDYRTTVSAILTTNAVIATIVNSLVLYSIFKTPSLHKPSYVLIANLALTDLISGSIVQPLSVLKNVTIQMNWMDAFCSVLLALKVTGYWMGAVSLLTITVIGVDRLLAIRLKTMYQSVVTLKRTAMVLLTGWIAGGVIVVISLVVLTLPIHVLVMLASAYQVLFVSISLACYSIAFHSLKKLTSSVSPSTTAENETIPTQNQSFNIKKYRKTFHSMLLVVLCVLLFYIPYIVCSLTFAMFVKDAGGYDRDDSSAVEVYKTFNVTEVIVEINSTANPLLYLWRMRDLRRAFVITLKKIFRQQINQH